jgi:hypothetical protein
VSELDDGIKRIGGFFSPVLFFVVGMLLLAFSTIFYPFIASAVDGTRATMATAGIQESDYWALAWMMTSTRFLLFIGGIFIILLGMGIRWLKRK